MTMDPYELPREFRGFVIAELSCAVCSKTFITAIRVDNFIGSYDGSFLHYPESGGCGASYSVVGSKGNYVIVRVLPPAGKSIQRDRVAYFVSVGETGYPVSPDGIGWHSP